MAFLLFLNVFLLVVGTLMDIFSAIVVVVPLLLPLAEIYGVNPVHLGIIFVANLELGFLHPPLGPEPAAGLGPVQEARARSDLGDAADVRHPRGRRAAHHLLALAHARHPAVDGPEASSRTRASADPVRAPRLALLVSAALLSAQALPLAAERPAVRRNGSPTASCCTASTIRRC